MLLSTFLHEQFHWLENPDPGFRDAMASFAEIWPDAPTGPPEGARDQQSTYRHLVVCDMELQAMTRLLGEQAARAMLESITHYTWISATVLSDPRVREVTTRHGMLVSRDFRSTYQ